MNLIGLSEELDSFQEYSCATAIVGLIADEPSSDMDNAHLLEALAESYRRTRNPVPYGRTTGHDATQFQLSLPIQWRVSFNPRDIIPNTVPAETAQDSAIASYWEKLRLSGVHERVFNDLFSAAVASKRVIGPYAPLSTDSLNMFLELWSTIKGFAGEPVVSVSPKGHVVAEWVHDGDNLLTVLATGDEFFYSLYEQGVPTEGRLANNALGDFVATMQARQSQPFSWSDA